MSKLYVLGDSWSWGWNQPHKKTGCFRAFETNMSTVLADKLGLELVNDSCPGNSFPQITQQFFRRISQHLTPTDVVFFCIPPDIRWHNAIAPGYNVGKQRRWSEDEDADEDTISVLFNTNGSQFNPKMVRPNHILNPESVNTLELEVMQNNFNMYWFKYHTSMQLTALSTWAKVNNANVFAQHNYGSLSDLCDFTDSSIVLDIDNSMWQWLGLPAHNLLEDANQDGPNAVIFGEDVFHAEYQLFATKLLQQWDSDGIDWHPNHGSQIEIGNKLYELCNERMG